MKKLIIVGASGHGKVVVDIAVKNGYEEIAFLDDNPEVKECGGYPVVGKVTDVEKFQASDFFVAIGNPAIREKIQKTLEEHYCTVVTLIHPNAVIAPDARIGTGTVVMAGTVINPGTVIGCGCIINTSATVDHDNVIGNYVHISVGSHTAGTVRIGDKTWIGAGSTVSNNVNICSDCMIGAGAVVVESIRETGTYVGVPARRKNNYRGVH